MSDKNVFELNLEEFKFCRVGLSICLNQKRYTHKGWKFSYIKESELKNVSD